MHEKFMSRINSGNACYFQSRIFVLPTSGNANWNTQHYSVATSMLPVSVSILSFEPSDWFSEIFVWTLLLVNTTVMCCLSVLQLVITITQMFRYVKWEKHKHHSHLHPEMLYRAVVSMNLQVSQLLMAAGMQKGVGRDNSLLLPDLQVCVKRSA
jgi:hypothetical protein